MSELRWVRLEQEESGLRTLTMDRPPVNALGRQLVADLIEAARRIEADDRARCVIVRSAGKHFSIAWSFVIPPVYAGPTARSIRPRQPTCPQGGKRGDEGGGGFPGACPVSSSRTADRVAGR